MKPALRTHRSLRNPRGLMGGIRHCVRVWTRTPSDNSRRPGLRRAGAGRCPLASPTRVPLDPVLEWAGGGGRSACHNACGSASFLHGDALYAPILAIASSGPPSPHCIPPIAQDTSPPRLDRPPALRTGDTIAFIAPAGPIDLKKSKPTPPNSNAKASASNSPQHQPPRRLPRRLRRRPHHRTPTPPSATPKSRPSSPAAAATASAADPRPRSTTPPSENTLKSSPASPTSPASISPSPATAGSSPSTPPCRCDELYRTEPDFEYQTRSFRRAPPRRPLLLLSAIGFEIDAPLPPHHDPRPSSPAALGPPLGRQPDPASAEPLGTPYAPRNPTARSSSSKTSTSPLPRRPLPRPAPPRRGSSTKSPASSSATSTGQAGRERTDPPRPPRLHDQARRSPSSPTSPSATSRSTPPSPTERWRNSTPARYADDSGKPGQAVARGPWDESPIFTLHFSFPILHSPSAYGIRLNAK